jgi:hypothetical protein
MYACHTSYFAKWTNGVNLRQQAKKLMVDNKTQVTAVDPMDFIMSMEHSVRQADALKLDTFFRKITGWELRMWGPTIIGYGA